jgi:ABC-type dipeptide/oligopeptide/nickel transport system permease component
MAVFLTRRLLLCVATIVTVSFGAFVCFGESLDPSYPLVVSTDQTPRHLVQAHYHLTDPILERYWLWVQNFAHHGFGKPASTNVVDGKVIDSTTRIGPELWHAGWLTIQLVGFSLVLVVGLSLLLGTVSSRFRGGAADTGVRLLNYVAWSVPAFLVAFFFRRWFAGSQTASSFVYGPQTIQHQGHPVFLIGPPTGGFVDWFQHMTLPAIALSLGLVGVYSRYVRSSMLVALAQPYAVVARAKGLGEGRVVVRHALRNSLIPFVSALSLEIGAIVGASLAADWVFSLGGLATLTIGALGRADPFEMTAVVVTLSAVVLVFMTLADLAVGWLDPRAHVAAVQ